MDILPPQANGFNIKSLRTLLLPLHTPQSQGTVHDVIREHVFACSLHLRRYKGGAYVPPSVLRVPRLQTFGASAAVVQVSGINKGTYTYNYQSTMSLFVIDFTTWKGRMVNLW